MPRPNRMMIVRSNFEEALRFAFSYFRRCLKSVPGAITLLLMRTTAENYIKPALYVQRSEKGW